MNIFDMFRSQPTQQQAPAQQTGGQQPAPQQQQQQATPGNLPNNPVQPDPNNPTVPNGTVDNSNQPQQQQTKDDSPLAGFEKLWDTKPENQQPEQKLSTPTAEQLDAAMQGVDFSKSVSQEDLTAIAAGGEGAVTALLNVLNTHGRAVMSQATQVSQRLAQTNIGEAAQSMNPTMEKMVRELVNKQQLQNSYPELQNPAIKPVADAIQAQLSVQYPQATSQEIAEMTHNFFKQTGAAFAEQPQPTEQQQQQAQTVDWDKWVTQSI